MARETKPKGKIVRRLGVNIYEQPKYDKLLKKKPQKPGKERGARARGKVSDFGRHLLEKQKLRYTYGLSEKQFYNLFLKAKKITGLTGDSMISLLERRLDNVVYRLGMASTRLQARQIVSHGHVRLNDKRADIPSITVKDGDVVKVRDREVSHKLIREQIAKNTGSVPEWLTLSTDNLEGKVERNPYRTEVQTYADEQMVVEFYSK